MNKFLWKVPWCLVWRPKPLLPIKQAKLASLWRNHACIDLAPVNVPAGVWITVNRPTCNYWNCSDKKQIPYSNLIESKNHLVWQRPCVPTLIQYLSFTWQSSVGCPLKCVHNHIGLRAFVTDAVCTGSFLGVPVPLGCQKIVSFIFSPLYFREDMGTTGFSFQSLFFFSSLLICVFCLQQINGMQNNKSTVV